MGSCTVKVPATSANMGSGFDTVGVALELYNYIYASETDSGLSITVTDPSDKFLPKDENNLVYQGMKAVFDKADYHPAGLKIVLENNIPVTRGLGSSSAGIVGGIVAANALCGNKLSRHELVTIAAKLEGHPDNTTPAITGGVAVAVKGEHVSYIKLPARCDDLRFALFIPKFTLNTARARSVLPKAVSHTDAVFNTSRSALLTAALVTKSYDMLHIAMQDRLHQPFRKCLIGGANRIFRFGREHRAYATYISGAGPTIVSVINKRNEEEFLHRAENFLLKHMNGWSIKIVSADRCGAAVIDKREE